MTQILRRYAWQVTLTNGELLDVCADDIEYAPGGQLVFWALELPPLSEQELERPPRLRTPPKDAPRSYVSLVIGAGQWRHASVQNAWTGEQTGYALLRESDAGKIAAEVAAYKPTKDIKREKRDRKNLSQKIRFDVFERDRFTCRYCGACGDRVKLHCDHVVPVSKGGTNDIANLVTACDACNQGKGARLLNNGGGEQHEASH